jgi:hypothetical protein
MVKAFISSGKDTRMEGYKGNRGIERIMEKK